MSSSLTLKEKYDALVKSYQSASTTEQDLQRRLEEFEGQNAYLHKQLSKSMKLNQKLSQSPTRSIQREHRPTITNINDFKVEFSEFEGKLDLDEFLEWLHTVERIFEYEEVPDDKKVKLVAPRLRKHTSLWWTNLCAKRVRDQKEKI